MKLILSKAQPQIVKEDTILQLGDGHLCFSREPRPGYEECGDEPDDYWKDITMMDLYAIDSREIRATTNKLLGLPTIPAEIIRKFVHSQGKLNEFIWIIT